MEYRLGASMTNRERRRDRNLARIAGLELRYPSADISIGRPADFV
jgi:hypothetical protein